MSYPVYLYWIVDSIEKHIFESVFKQFQKSLSTLDLSGFQQRARFDPQIRSQHVPSVLPSVREGHRLQEDGLGLVNTVCGNEGNRPLALSSSALHAS